MKKIDAIEGLRGWLAWTVVFSHLAMTSDIYAKGLGPIAVEAGQYAVLIFVIISGFVITHLVLERPEPYSRYLLRRFMRIFPLFAVTCIFGFFACDIYAATLARVPWFVDPNFAKIVSLFVGVANSNHEFLWAHILAHLTMLHGAISNSALPFSEYAFNPPAWSLSLEWQFYLIAPLLITLARRPFTFAWLAFVFAVLEFAYNRGLLGNFDAPSFFPGAARYFALGIASRIAYPMLKGTLQHASIIFVSLLLLIPLGWTAVPLLVWAVTLAGLMLGCTNARRTILGGIYHHLLESSVATYCGSRSYSVYLCHLPIVAVCHALWLCAFPTALHFSTFLGVLIMAIPFTAIVSELLYRGIERPGIAFGSRLIDKEKKQRAFVNS